ncbi:MAG: 50S ribosomal protein L21 [Deltaproteobacteria bacterium RIFOXYA12_FULL_58_15]|nr:MAG: 50S ribosomal protein L21 [Deltaproteobacteria bacterium RIFOXYA12_FULL_58_15]OGR08820.1 MAG: 50S ribosomal protein L21 [Deltaproteobacteria bacterium RIFOXYB12_FULL_58_9]
MYAVIRSGGKQHRVVKGEHLRVEKLDGAVGSSIELSDVLLVAGEGDPKIGQPRVDGATVTATIVAQERAKKIRVFKRQKRLGFHKTIGHRQYFTELEITGIQG